MWHRSKMLSRMAELLHWFTKSALVCFSQSLQMGFPALLSLPIPWTFRDTKAVLTCISLISILEHFFLTVVGNLIFFLLKSACWYPLSIKEWLLFSCFYPFHIDVHVYTYPSWIANFLQETCHSFSAQLSLFFNFHCTDFVL